MVSHSHIPIIEEENCYKNKNIRNEIATNTANVDNILFCIAPLILLKSCQQIVCMVRGAEKSLASPTGT